jgi:hypothetical protein
LRRFQEIPLKENLMDAGKEDSVFADKCSECGKKPLLCVVYGMVLREACNLIKGKYFVHKKSYSNKIIYFVLLQARLM